MGSSPPPQVTVAAPPPDPASVQQAQDAQNKDLLATQQSVSADTQNLLAQFGSAAQRAGSGVSLPFSQVTGGLTPMVTPLGAFIQPQGGR